MNPNLLKKAIEDAKDVRQQALDNARKELEKAFGYSIEGLKDGITRYILHTPSGVDKVYDEIERNGFVILDEDENGNWIDVISPKQLESNISAEDMLNEMSREVSKEIDKEVLDYLIKVADRGPVC